MEDSNNADVSVPIAHPDQDAGQDRAILRALRAEPGNLDAQLDRGLDESMDASDPPTAVQPGDTGEAVPSSGFDADKEAEMKRVADDKAP